MNRNQMLAEIAAVVSLRSTCSRLNVGAVLSREGRVISLGYNGAPAGVDHCDHTNDRPGDGCAKAVHAEANAIAFAARYGVATDRSVLHVTHMPCRKCAELIINAGIREVDYEHPYRDPSGIILLEEGGVNVYGPAPYQG